MIQYRHYLHDDSHIQSFHIFGHFTYLTDRYQMGGNWRQVPLPPPPNISTVCHTHFSDSRTTDKTIINLRHFRLKTSSETIAKHLVFTSFSEGHTSRLPSHCILVHLTIVLICGPLPLPLLRINKSSYTYVVTVCYHCGWTSEGPLYQSMVTVCKLYHYPLTSG